MNVALFCWRPYQIFNAINIVYNNIESTRGNTTLFIYNFPVLTKFENSLNETGLFKKVVMMNNHLESGDHVRKFVGQIFPNITFFNTTGRQQSYKNYFDKILATSFNLDMLELVLINKDAHIIIYEDGVNSYSYDDMFRHLNPKLRAFKKYIGKDLYKIKVSKKYFYSPELISYRTECAIKKIPSIKNEVSKIQKKVFSYDSEKARYAYGDRRIVYLDQSTKSNNYIQLFQMLSKYHDSVIFRPHPNIPSTSELFDIDKSEQSWELICSECVTNDTILISPASMALFTPNMIYDKQPTIIVIAKLLIEFDSYEMNQFLLFCESFKEKCKYPNIFIPKTFDELNNILCEKTKEKLQ